MISGRSRLTTYEKTENLKPGIDLLGHRGAADQVPPLEHDHPLAGTRQVGRGDEAVVPAADDDGVVARCSRVMRASAPD